MKVNFTKMHSLGNDFILIDCRLQRFKDSALENLSKKLCHRRFGIGADQLLMLYTSNIADFKMRIFNADGSEAKICGNGARCLAKYLWDRELSNKDVLHIETPAGIIRAEKSADMIKVDLGEPIFEPERIPVIVEGLMTNKPIIDYPLQVDGREFKVTCLSMGNPHAIVVVDNISDFPLTYYGPLIENHPVFPEMTNVEFIEVLNPFEISMRVWERGSGETMACGTGAAAVAVASNIKGLTGRNVTVHLLGGDLYIEWAENNHVYVTGPAVEVFEGILKIN